MVDNIDSLFDKAVTTEARQRGDHDFPYGELLGNLVYLSTHTRAGVSFVVNVLCYFVKNPHTIHWCTGKRMMRYLAGIIIHEILVGDV